jgi:cellulose biosynthesis protein BcsQ
MAISISLINMKGGVGKTTLAAQLAHAAARRDLRTLAVDLDPQANLSQALLSPETYVKHPGTRGQRLSKFSSSISLRQKGLQVLNPSTSVKSF